MRERRKSRRVAVYARGLIGFRGKYRLRCLVQNCSKIGAKLSLEKAADLPDVFTLNFSHHGVRVAYQAHVKWRTRMGLGVELAPPSVADVEPVCGLAAT
jgi:PilZ domain